MFLTQSIQEIQNSRKRPRYLKVNTYLGRRKRPAQRPKKYFQKNYIRKFFQPKGGAYKGTRSMQNTKQTETKKKFPLPHNNESIKCMNMNNNNNDKQDKPNQTKRKQKPKSYNGKRPSHI